MSMTSPPSYTLEQFEAALDDIEEKHPSKTGQRRRENGSATNSRFSNDSPRNWASRPELVIEAIKTRPNTAENNPTRADFVKWMIAIKAALGPRREDYYGQVLEWALGYSDNDGKFVREVWDSIKDAEIGADWLFAQTRAHGFSGDAQDDFAAPPYDPESFCILDADVIRGRADELAVLKFGWPEAYNEVLEYHEMMCVIEVSELEELVAREAVKYGAENSAPQSNAADVLRSLKYLLLDSVSTLPEPLDFVEDLLCEGDFSVFFGKANVGKSFIALDVGLHVALGWKWQGREVDRGVVIYIAGEGAGGMKLRIEAFRAHYGVDKTADAAFALIPDMINFRDTTSVNGLIEIVRKIAAEFGMPVRWIIVDTLSRAMAGGNENDSKDMGELVRGADQVRSATGAHLTFVHHTGKDDSKGARGHSLLNGAVDTEIEVWRSDAAEGAIGVTVTKQRDLERGRGFAFKLVTKDVGKNRRGKTLSSCVVETTTIKAALTEGEQQVLETLKTMLAESGATEVLTSDWRKTALEDEDFAAGQKEGSRSRAFLRARTGLEKKKYIDISGANVTTRAS